MTAGAHVHLRTSSTPSAVTSAWTWAYGDCAKGGLGSESFPCSSTDSAQVTFPTPWLRLPVATQSLGLPHDASADFLLSVSCLTSPRRPRPTLTSLTNCRCLSAEVGRMFTPEELRTHLAVLVPRVEAAPKADAEPDEDNFEMISPLELAARLERLGLMKQLLEVNHLGTS